jgi:DNA-directed RNA polymerase specialized sigma subunit
MADGTISQKRKVITMSNIQLGVRQPRNDNELISMLDIVVRVESRMTTVDPFELAQADEWRRLLMIAVSRLSEIEKTVLICRFFKSMTLLETSKVIGKKTREQVRQIEMRAIRNLMKDADIETFKRSLFDD